MAKARLDAHRAEVQNLETLRRQYEESLPILRELFYTQLLDGRIRAELGQNNIRAELFRQFKGFLSVFCLPDQRTACPLGAGIP